MDERITFEVEDTSGPDRWIESLEWGFGDGEAANGWWTEHRYDSPGTCIVELTATDNTGHTTIHEVTITVA